MGSPRGNQSPIKSYRVDYQGGLTSKPINFCDVCRSHPAWLFSATVIFLSPE